MISDTGTYHAIFNTWYLTPVLAMLYLIHDIWHRYLPCYTWHLISDTGACHAILDTWYLTPVLAMLYLTFDIWHGTCHVILAPDIRHRHLTCYHSLNMLSPGTSTLDLILWHLTCYCHTWHLYYMAYSWLSLLWGLGIILLPNIWYSWTPVLLNFCISCTHVPCMVTLVNSTVIPASGRAFRCRDDEMYPTIVLASGGSWWN